MLRAPRKMGLAAQWNREYEEKGKAQVYTEYTKYVK
jgi:hypothetical protein